MRSRNILRSAANEIVNSILSLPVIGEFLIVMYLAATGLAACRLIEYIDVWWRSL